MGKECYEIGQCIAFDYISRQALCLRFDPLRPLVDDDKFSGDSSASLKREIKGRST